VHVVLLQACCMWCAEMVCLCVYVDLDRPCSDQMGALTNLKP
jgi:hypothetical protein